jgi:predicted ATPase
MNLLLGANGSGKSNVLETIRLIRGFVCAGRSSSGVFPASGLCRWETRRVQTIEIDLRGEEGIYTYKLEIEHPAEYGKYFVKGEQLAHNQRPIYASDAGNGQLYGDHGVTKVVLAKDRSGVGILDDGALLSRFKRRLERVWSLRINPDKMTATSRVESAYPNEDMSNFAAWYKHLVLDQPALVSKLTEVLKTGVLDGFRSLRLKAVGEKSRALLVEFGVQANDDLPEGVAEYRLSELSDGQRMLIALYALATCAMDEENTLCLDHPESYLALPEIQPWLLRLADATEEGRCQAIIATHHPELINLLAASSGYWLERQSGGPTRVRRISEQDTSGLPVSELIARGWLHG